MQRIAARVFALFGVLLLAACAGGEQGPLPLAQQQTVSYKDDGPPSITIITMINNRSGAGGHSAMMVSGSQRVLFDPAGSYRPDYITEYGDVIYGMTNRQYRAYLSAHARNSHHVVMQTLLVSPQAAETALALVQGNGRVAGAFCTNALSGLLQQVPGFADISVTFYPKKLMDQIAQRSGVVTDKLFENDAGDVLDGIPANLPLE